jgi:hypothetical protein
MPDNPETILRTAAGRDCGEHDQRHVRDGAPDPELIAQLRLVATLPRARPQPRQVEVTLDERLADLFRPLG